MTSIHIKKPTELLGHILLEAVLVLFSICQELTICQILYQKNMVCILVLQSLYVD